MISIRNLTRMYGHTVAVRDVSIDIGRGEIVGLLGHNGAGKTTIMKVLTGYLEPTKGTVEVGGHDVVTARQQAQRHLGYLPENAPLYTDMLVQEYLLMMADLRGLRGDVRTNAVVDAARRTGITDHLVRPIAALSKGYRQRVGIAQAMLHSPDVLVLDEPTNGLDPMQIEAIRGLIRELGQQSTVILSTHILQEVEAVCDRVLVMIDGELAADAPLNELRTLGAWRRGKEGAFQLELGLAGEPAGVEAALLDVDGVGAVTSHTPADDDADLAWYLLTCDADTPASDVVAACVGKGWRVERIGRVRFSLEDVFKQLQAQYIARRREEAAA